MKKQEKTFQINGEQPSIIDDVCQGFYLIQLQEGIQITDQANVAYFMFSEKWYRLYFDGTTIFWRESESPGEPINNRFDSALVLVNLTEMNTVVGQRLKNISYNRMTDFIETVLSFTNNNKLKFQHFFDQDITYIKC